MEERNTQATSETPEACPLDNLRFGFRVWLGEIRLMCIGLGRSFEIRQLEKRLEQEQAHLGRHTAQHMLTEGEGPLEPSLDMIRSARQVQFLQDEIVRLREEQEQAAERAENAKRTTCCSGQHSA